MLEFVFGQSTQHNFEPDDVDGGFYEIDVDCAEDFTIAMMWIAYMHTFAREVQLEQFSVGKERQKVVDFILQMYI